MHGRILVAALLGALAVPTTAQAAWRLTPEGQPLITNGFGGPAQVFVCPPGGAPCAETAWNTTADYGPAFAPGETAVGTTFEVRTTHSPPDRSPAWQGQVTPAVPPAVTGPAVARATVGWKNTRWQGGWGDTRSTLRMFACRTRAATGCHELPEIGWCGRACDTVIERRSEGYVIPDALVGYFAFVSQDPSPADWRGVPIPVLASPSGPWSTDRPWDFSPGPRTTLSAPAGPIEPAFTLALRKRPFRRNGKLRLGSVTCPTRCEAAVTVSGGGKRTYRTAFPAKGTKGIVVPYRSGRLTVRVSVDGRHERTLRVVAR